MLAELLSDGGILLQKRARGWRAAIRLAAQPLLDSGAIEPEYVEAMVASVENNGPYMVVAPGVALAHARPGQGVNRVCFSVLTLKTPVKFGNPDFDPVDLVIAFGTTSNTAHIEALRELAQVLMEPKNVAAIRASTKPEESLVLFSQACGDRQQS